GGVLVLTTRSEGFPLHGYPEDWWRFSVEAMGAILQAAGLDVERLEPDPDPASPGVFARARKPAGWTWPDVQAAWDGAGVTAVLGWQVIDRDGNVVQSGPVTVAEMAASTGGVTGGGNVGD
ncbi:MAG: hypothetical protein JWM19_3996, partial [Actinomycetia bacterium]|nr:hypothetical protein [Actinomycetes bacterium]